MGSWILAAGAALGGCSELGGELLGEPAGSGFSVQRTSPADGAVDVDPSAPIVVRFSAPPDPDSITAKSVQVLSGRFFFPAAPRVDLLERTVTLTPQPALPSAVRVTVVLSSDVAALGGELLGRAEAWSFRSAPHPTAPRTPSAAPAPTLRDEVAPLFARSGCAAAGCHDGQRRAAGLDLSSLEAARSDLVGVRASQRPALRRVAPGDPARSYLLRKLAGTGDIAGAVMPTDARLPPADVRLVARWIEAGAPVGGP